jgi:hypothetical protein
MKRSPVFQLGRNPEMDCPAILKISRPGTPGLDEVWEVCSSIDTPFLQNHSKNNC